MMIMKNEDGRPVLLSMVNAVHENKQFLGDVDGMIGDGDHGMNMNKGFMMFSEELRANNISFSEGLSMLGTTLFQKIGGSMGPIYGTIFMSMADKIEDKENINLKDFSEMLQSALDGLYDIVDARPGDKTIVDTLYPASQYLNKAASENVAFDEALDQMKDIAQKGMESTKGMIAKFGRASRLGERSLGVQDAGATSCYIILSAMADGMRSVLQEVQ